MYSLPSHGLLVNQGYRTRYIVCSCGWGLKSYQKVLNFPLMVVLLLQQQAHFTEPEALFWVDSQLSNPRKPVSAPDSAAVTGSGTALYGILCGCCSFGLTSSRLCRKQLTTHTAASPKVVTIVNTILTGCSVILWCSLLVMNGTHFHVPLWHLCVFFSEMFLHRLSFAHVLIGLCILALLIVFLCVCSIYQFSVL